ncbi:ornithine cyclodeaminase [Noviherbaspirillum aridicola]|uniref:Ornithine cyclodeaminase n=1 Tax=Noviherbaspirillum aridicola TaxID=2849687 RepID=A0ABQ4PZ83_9BURK|nr:ornithine cyclodeaminase [Noviherbaspirillum aridicola]GIZ50187.1 ornithine cyclodeaminase [Noviherbaspirillum aridicola]
MQSTIHAGSARTLFLDAPAVARLIAGKGLQQCIAGIAEAIRADFLRWPDFVKSPRSASHCPQGVIELMPVSDATLFGFKYVNGHPGNLRFGLPTVMAFGVLAEMKTGMPLLLCDLTLPTALRTAAMSALAAVDLARKDSRVMALIGNGAQSEFQALAFRDLVGIDELRLYDIDPAATRKLMRNLEGSGLRMHACAGIAEAVRGADIVTTVTADKRNATIVSDDMLAPGMHINAVGGDCPGKTELSPAVLAAASVFVEYAPQTRIEGDIQQMPADFPVTEIWQVLAGAQPGRRHDKEITVFDSVGFALEDYSALRFLHAAALETDAGEEISLVGTAGDPRDLFASLGLAARPGLVAA